MLISWAHHILTQFSIPPAPGGLPGGVLVHPQHPGHEGDNPNPIPIQSDIQVIHTIRDTPPNPSGLLSLSTDSSHCYLAYPGTLAIFNSRDYNVTMWQFTMFFFFNNFQWSWWTLYCLHCLQFFVGHSHTGELQVFDCINLASRVNVISSIIQYHCNSIHISIHFRTAECLTCLNPF